MVSVQSPPGGRELPYARVLLLPAIVMAAATGAAVAMVTDPARAAVGWCGAIATLLVIVIGAEAVRRGRVARDLRADLVHRTSYLEQRIAAHDQETLHFSREVLPVALNRLHAGASPRRWFAASIGPIRSSVNSPRRRATCSATCSG